MRYRLPFSSLISPRGGAHLSAPGTKDKTQRGYKNSAGACAAFAVFLMLIFSLILFTTQSGYAVYVHGDAVGSAKDINTVAQAIKSAEGHISDILGYSYSLENSLEISADMLRTGSSPDDLGEAIMEKVPEISRLYALEIDGVVAGASENREVLESILDDILRDYETEDTIRLRFKEAVSINYKFVSADTLQGADKIRELLEPSNTGSPFALTVERLESVTHTEEIPYDTAYKYDSGMYAGETRTVIHGKEGTVEVTEHVLTVNSVEKSRETIASLLVSEPVTETVIVGTKYRPPYTSYGYYIWPAEGDITSEFGPRDGFGSPYHHGLDIGASYRSDVLAADGGTVILAGWDDDYGNFIQIEHDNGDITCYAHCDELLVSVGDKVSQGDVIAYVGTTGYSSGYHLHFEIRVDGEVQNPLDYLP